MHLFRILTEFFDFEHHSTHTQAAEGVLGAPNFTSNTGGLDKDRFGDWLYKLELKDYGNETGMLFACDGMSNRRIVAGITSWTPLPSSSSSRSLTASITPSRSSTVSTTPSFSISTTTGPSSTHTLTASSSLYPSRSLTASTTPSRSLTVSAIPSGSPSSIVYSPISSSSASASPAQTYPLDCNSGVSSVCTVSQPVEVGTSVLAFNYSLVIVESSLTLSNASQTILGSNQQIHTSGDIILQGLLTIVLSAETWNEVEQQQATDCSFALFVQLNNRRRVYKH